jgi:peptidoglycan-N-acetylglucosamine deacetylase
MPFDASFTCDLEPDCPPYLHGFRGVEEGLPRLLGLLDQLGIKATFFTTGEVAQKYPEAVRAVLAGGHEVGCHGMTHTAFTSMGRNEARAEIEESAAILRGHAPVTSFRAPYLKFPDEYLDLLEGAAFLLDSSQAKYKKAYYDSRRANRPTSLTRIPASLTSSALRIPKLLREAYVRAVSKPVVLFVHPWEFTDLRKAPIPLHCSFRTGDVALACVGDVLRGMQRRGARFSTMRDLAGRAA